MPIDKLSEAAPIQPFRLTDRIKHATLPEIEVHEDGSTTLYIRVVPIERYSTLPQLAQTRRRWFFGARGASSEPADHLAGRVNVRRVRRRNLHRS